MKAVLLAALAVSSTLAAAAAEPQESTKPDKTACFYVDRIHSYRVLESRKLAVASPGKRDWYLIELGMPLPELEHSLRVAFIDHDSDGQFCGRSRDRISVPDANFNQPSIVLGITKLDDSQIAALEQQYGTSLVSKPKSPENSPADQ